MTAEDARTAVAEAHRREWARVLAATVRVAGNFELAEECVQEAYGLALDTWPRTGVPTSPGAWLTTAARRRALDALRRDSTLRRKLPLLAGLDIESSAEEEALATDDGPVLGDDLLRLVFTCCHPALSREGQISLTLRLVLGLTTAEIGQAFVVPDATVAARITRAKKKIAAARIPYRVPDEAELPDRLDAVLTVVHLLFTTGHTAPAGPDLVRVDLTERAVSLGRLLADLMPDEPEVRGLLALMLLDDARRATRTAQDGSLLLLADQDRERWDHRLIAEAVALLQPVATPAAGRFVLQAAIAAAHVTAPTSEGTDWPLVRALYDRLLQLWPSPVVRLNRAVAVLMTDGVEPALAELSALERDGRLSSYRYLWATKGEVLRRSGRRAEAEAAYARALELAESDVERAFLARRVAEVRTDGAAAGR